jgi:hypothetical protein
MPNGEEHRCLPAICYQGGERRTIPFCRFVARSTDATVLAVDFSLAVLARCRSRLKARTAARSTFLPPSCRRPPDTAKISALCGGKV